MKQRSLGEINERIKDGNAKVMTAEELSSKVRENEEVTLDDVDVVTTGTCGIMSGTAAILSFPIDGGDYRKIDKIWLNGVEGYPGPCPNESLSVVDLIVYGTNHSRDDHSYGGSHLFSDLVSGKEINIAYVTDTGKKGETKVQLDEIP
ncbi:MAG: homocysteine biosynthesis protein, partial [Halobacteriota archaeon]|nr:homocysteine biosynthesis protein [Halobacteriota archaeon]